jgi:hypothetical protein
VCAAPTDLPSGYGIRGSSIFQRTRPGYTIDIGQWDTHVGTIIYHLDYDLQTAFAPIGLMTVNPQLLVARKGFPADDPSCGPAALAKRSWLICTASTREVSTIPLFQVVTKNRKLVCESTHRSWHLTYLISFHVRPGRTSRLLSCGSSVVGLILADPAQTFAKRQSDKNNIKHHESRFGAFLLQSTCDSKVRHVSLIRSRLARWRRASCAHCLQIERKAATSNARLGRTR